MKEFPETWSIFYIDVRDAALAHVRAALAPSSVGNQRYLIAGPGIGTNKMVSIVFGFKSNGRFVIFFSNIILTGKSHHWEKKLQRRILNRFLMREKRQKLLELTFEASIKYSRIIRLLYLVMKVNES